jgi:uncharacterized protein (TIRG00374 family)
VKLLIAAFATVFIIYYLSLGDVYRSFLRSRQTYIVLAGVLVIPNILLQFIKWKYLLRLIKPEVKNGEVFASLLVGFTVGIFTPGRIGEYGGRMFYIKKCNRLQVAGLTIIDKAFNLFSTIAFGLVGLLLFFKLSFDYPRIILFPEFFLAGLFLATLVFLFVSPDSMKRIIRTMNFKSRVYERIKPMLASIDNFHRKEALVVLGLSLVLYFVVFLQFHLLTLAFQSVPLWVGFVSITSTMLAKTLIPSFTIGELSIRSSAAIMFYAQFGVNGATAFSASILLYVVNVVLPSAVGLFLIPRLTFDSKNNGRILSSDNDMESRDAERLKDP